MGFTVAFLPAKSGEIRINPEKALRFTDQLGQFAGKLSVPPKRFTSHVS
jgi:hypothetical protein